MQFSLRLPLRDRFRLGAVFILLLCLAFFLNSQSSLSNAEPALDSDSGLPVVAANPGLGEQSDAPLAASPSGETEDKLLDEIRLAPIAGPEMRRAFDNLVSTKADVPSIFAKALADNDQLLGVQLSYAFRGNDRDLASATSQIATRAINDSNADKKLLAIECAGLIGVSGTKLVDELAQAIDNKNPKVRYRAVVALGRLANRTEKIRLLLARAAKDKSETVAFRAASLIDGTVSPEKSIHIVEASVAGTITKPSPPLKISLVPKDARGTLKDLNSKDNAVKAQAAMLAGLSTNPDPRVINALENNLHSTDERVRFSASYALGQLGLPALPALARAMNDPDTAVRLKAVQALKQVTPATEDVAQILEPGLSDTDQSIRLQTALAIVAMQPANEQAMQILIESLGSNHELSTAIEPVLKKVEAQAALPGIMGHLHSDDPVMRSGAARALGAIGPDNSKTIEELTALLEDPNTSVQRSAQVALGEIRMAHSE